MIEIRNGNAFAVISGLDVRSARANRARRMEPFGRPASNFEFPISDSFRISSFGFRVSA
jgi:hypothetical protein